MVHTRLAAALAAGVMALPLIALPAQAESSLKWWCTTNVVGTLCGTRDGDRLKAKYYPPSGRDGAGIFGIRTGKSNYQYKYSKPRYVEVGELTKFTWQHQCNTYFKVYWHSNKGTDPEDLSTAQFKCSKF